MTDSEARPVAKTVFVTSDRLLPIGRRWRHTEIVRNHGLKYERCVEDGTEYQRLLNESETHAGPWRTLNGEMA